MSVSVCVWICVSTSVWNGYDGDLLLLFLAHQHKAAGMEIKLSKNNDHDGYHMASNVARKATAFPFWRAIDKRWNRNTVSLESSVTAVMRLLISWISFIADWFQAPAVSTATDWQKDARGRQCAILYNLVLFCLVCCWAWFSGSLIYVWHSIGVRNCEMGLPRAQDNNVVPSGRFPSCYYWFYVIFVCSIAIILGLVFTKQILIISVSVFISITKITLYCDHWCWYWWLGIAHRDLKPDNILCVYSDQLVPVKLIDFDLASSFMLDGNGSDVVTTPRLRSPVSSHLCNLIKCN